MKIVLLKTLVCCLFFTGCKKNNPAVSILPAAASEEQTLFLQKEFLLGFKELEVSQSIEAEIIKADKQKIVISAPADLIDEIAVEKFDDRVTIHYSAGIRVIGKNQVKAKIYTQNFPDIKANSAAKLISRGSVFQENIQVYLLNGSSFEGNLYADNVTLDLSNNSIFKGKIVSRIVKINASSGAEMNFTGNSDAADLILSSGTAVDAGTAEFRKINALVSSNSELKIGVRDTARVQSSSGANVQILRKGKAVAVEKNESSGGIISVE